MKNKLQKWLLFTCSGLMLLQACKKDDDLVPVPPPVANESEVITTLQITFKDSLGVKPDVTAIFRDPDGDGGNAPVQFDSIRLEAGTPYLATISLLDETKSPAEDIGAEVIEEANDHFFCFTPSAANVSVRSTDLYGSYTLGMKSTWTTGAASRGAVLVKLKHQPGVKNGSCDPGETDIEVNFGIVIR
jgi:hypothetical protein